MAEMRIARFTILAPGAHSMPPLCDAFARQGYNDFRMAVTQLNSNDSPVDSQYDLANLLFPDREDVTEFETIDIPPEQRRLITDSVDYTVSSIINAIDEKEIIIPKFQRNYVWTLQQASRLIESLIIQCPIPTIYLSEEPDDRLLVIDGNQRLLSLYNYKKNRFALTGLSAYSDLNGLRFSELDPRFQRHINTRALRFIKITKETHPLIKFDVFERINSGAVKLTAQELRHGLYYGPLMAAIDDVSQQEEWSQIASQGEDVRMRSGELLLRFWAMRYELNSYKKPLEDFLNEFSERHRDIQPELLGNWKREALNVAGIIRPLFGRMAFRSIDKRGYVTSLINSAIFDAEMVGVAVAKNRNSLGNIDADRFQAELREFLETDDDFRRFVSAATSDLPSVLGRIRRFTEFIESRST